MKKTALYLFLLLSLSPYLFAQPIEGTLLGHWKDPDIVGSRYYNNAYNEVWGLAVNGHEYGIIGSTFGTHFIDVSDPQHPFEAFRIAGAAQGPGIVHRDYHDYQCLLYAVSDEGKSSLQIMDISQLPDTVTVLYDSDELLVRTHNIFIDSSAGKLYTLATKFKTGSAALAVFDLMENPLKPRFLGKYHTFGDLSVSHVHDAYVRDNIAFLNCGFNGLAIVDFSDPFNPKTYATLKTDEYPFSGYNHSGWLGDNGIYYYMADETHGKPMKVINVTDLHAPQAVQTFKSTSNDKNTIPHNEIVNGHFLYVSHYYDGLQVFDLTKPDSPVPYMYYPTTKLPNDKSYKGAWGVYPFLPSGNILVSDMQEGLFIIRNIDPKHHRIYNCKRVSNATTLPHAAKHTRIWIRMHRLLLDFDSADAAIKKKMEIFDMNGRMIRYEMIPRGVSHTELMLPELPCGIYIVKLSTAHSVFTKKLYYSDN